jgi:Oxysterol-binding protein.
VSSHVAGPVCSNELTGCSILTQPNMYARGVLFGRMLYELGDHSYVKCPEIGLVADIEFKTKGWISGTYNAIYGKITEEKTGNVLYEITGHWNKEMFIEDMRVSLSQLALTPSLAN